MHYNIRDFKSMNPNATNRLKLINELAKKTIDFCVVK